MEPGHNSPLQRGRNGHFYQSPPEAYITASAAMATTRADGSRGSEGHDAVGGLLLAQAHPHHAHGAAERWDMRVPRRTCAFRLRHASQDPLLHSDDGAFGRGGAANTGRRDGDVVDVHACG